MCIVFPAPSRNLRVYKYVSFTRKWLYLYWDHIYNYWNESYVEGYKVSRLYFTWYSVDTFINVLFILMFVLFYY